MNKLRTTDARWEAIDQGGGRIVFRSSNTDTCCAEFRNEEGSLVLVEITAQELKDFGEALNDDKKALTEQVLREVLDAYIDCYGCPPSRIGPRDLGCHLEILRIRFHTENNA